MADAWHLSVADCDVTLASSQYAPFLRDLFMQVQRQAMGSLPLPEPALLQMLEQQHNAQVQEYKRAFPLAVNMILLKDGQPVGRLYVDFSSDPVHMIDFAIVPSMQSKGIGSNVLQSLCEAAQNRSVRLSLKVLSGQRAEKLYARFGFEVTDRNVPFASMVWSGS
ncbi:hypothetical protein GCM10007385_44410 [Tateyamaria omphalii]|uniref:GNAT family N-acetyltransferase n=1 Tax=Tateyamaria omphalii TaxID=299262 RepID=UPI0016790CA8|nr:GNAT family N-acetyltransferase [Tateyamaria omphalii]GGX70503.1 hypothetical protein GCM10007385_44410 [Tateyamaria omphalii]